MVSLDVRRQSTTNLLADCSDVRVLLLHNRYKLHGGEDVVVQQEAALLRDAGASVDLLEVSNSNITTFGDKLQTSLSALYSPAARELVRRRLRQHRANLLHVHNFFPKLSPSVYDAAAEAQCAVVQTLHNYRLVCPAGTLFRDGHICTECLDRAFAWPSVEYGCYRESRIGSATIALMTAIHRARATWQERVHRYVVLNDFAHKVFVTAGGLPPERVSIKPNVISDTGLGTHDGGYALFVGRLSPEKGINTLLRAATRPNFPLRLFIAGTGPLAPSVVAAVSERPDRITYLGPQSRDQVTELVGRASVVIVPSEWHEAGGPLTIGEAFARGTPVITTLLEPMNSVVQDGIQGLLYPPADAEGLAHAVHTMVAQPNLIPAMRVAARDRYMEMYLPENNLSKLLAIYDDAKRAQRTR